MKVRFREPYPHRIKYNLQCAFGYGCLWRGYDSTPTIDVICRQKWFFSFSRTFVALLFCCCNFFSLSLARIMHPLSGFGRVIKVLKLNLLLDFRFPCVPFGGSELSLSVSPNIQIHQKKRHQHDQLKSAHVNSKSVEKVFFSLCNSLFLSFHSFTSFVLIMLRSAKNSIQREQHVCCFWRDSFVE